MLRGCLYKEAREERLRRRREADRLRKQREIGAERDARIVRNSVLAVLYYTKHTDWLAPTMLKHMSSCKRYHCSLDSVFNASISKTLR